MAILNVLKRMCTLREEWPNELVSRGSIKKFLVVTVAYVFTDIPLFFGHPQPLPFFENGLQLLKKKILEMIPKYGRTEAQSWP